MNDQDLNNLPENNKDDNNYVGPLEVACSAEFPEGCIFRDEDK